MPNDHLIGRVPSTQCSHDKGIEEHAVPQIGLMIRYGGVIPLLLPSRGLERFVSISKRYRDIHDCHGLLRLIYYHKVRSDSSIHSRRPMLNPDVCGSWSIQGLYQPVLCDIVPPGYRRKVGFTMAQNMRQCLVGITTPAALLASATKSLAPVAWYTVQTGSMDEAPIREASEGTIPHEVIRLVYGADFPIHFALIWFRQ